MSKLFRNNKKYIKTDCVLLFLYFVKMSLIRINNPNNNVIYIKTKTNNVEFVKCHDPGWSILGHGVSIKFRNFRS